jgi:hypothetical protein
VAKIRTIELSSLNPVKERKPSARQLGLMKREATYESAIAKLQRGQALAFEPSDEKLPTLRASLKRVIARNERAAQLHFAIIGGICYVALDAIPGSRKPRRKKAASAE